MELFTSVVYAAAPGRDPGLTGAGGEAGARDGEPAGPEQILVLPAVGLLAVADSQTPRHGRVAARLAIDQIRTHVERHADLFERFRRNPTVELRQDVLGWLEDLFARIAHEIFAFGRRRGPLAVTLDVALLLEHEAFVGHVGDGRVYLVRRGLVHQLTVDQLRGDDPFDPSTGEDGPPEVHVLGISPQVRPETLCIEIAPEDRFAVCAASIHRVLPDGILHTRLCSEHLDQLGSALANDAPYSSLLGACAQLDSMLPFSADSAQARLARLAPMPLFAHCTDRELRAVAQATFPRRFRAESLVFEEGHPGTELFLVISGGVQVSRGGSVITELGPGSTFGEMALLDEPTRSATVVTLEDTELMVISRQSFFSLLRAHPRLAVKVLWNLLLGVSANLRRTNDRVAELEQQLAQWADHSS